MSNQLRISCLVIVLVVLLAAMPAARAGSVPVVLDVDRVLATVPSTYLGTTIDIATFVDHDHCNLQNETLRAMTNALGCSHIRIGGTRGDVTYYNNFPRGLNISGPADLPPNFSSVLDWKAWRHALEFVAATGLRLYFGLNAGWGGAGLVRNNYSDGGAWLPTMASWLLDDVMASGLADVVEGFEFSNEPNLFPFNGLFPNETLAASLNGSHLANDIATVRNTLSSYRASWKLVCCDVAYVPLFGEIDAFMDEFRNAGGMSLVDVATFHFYPLLAGSYNKTLPPYLDPFYASLTKVLDPYILNQVGYWADAFVQDAGIAPPALRDTPDDHRPTKAAATRGSPQRTSSSSTTSLWHGPVILGETGSAVGGGQPGLSNRYADVVEYFDKIGQMTRRGQQHMFRQTLCGSPDQYYALISSDGSTSPSYFATAVVNSLLLGGAFRGNVHDPVDAPAPNVTVWNVTVISSLNDSPPLNDQLRIYAFDGSWLVGNRSVLVALCNLNSTEPLEAMIELQNHTAGTATFDASTPMRRLVMASCRASEVNATVEDLLSAACVTLNGALAAWDAETSSIVPPLNGSLLEPISSGGDCGTCVINATFAKVEVLPLQWTFVWIPLATA